MYVSGDWSVRQSAATSRSTGLDHDEVLVDIGHARIHQQLLDHHLDRGVLALAEVVVADPALGIGDVRRRPEVVVERLPDAVVAVDGDRIVDAEAARPRDDVVDVPLEAELGRVHADDREPGWGRTSSPTPGGTAASGAS